MRLVPRRSGIGGAFTSAHTFGTGMVIAALALTMAALLIPVRLFEGTAMAGPGGLIVDDRLGTLTTQYGPLTPTDRDFVRKVRSAGLWEGPAGRQAQERGQSETVRIAGDHLVDGHNLLDELAIETGRVLGIELPNQPSAQQRAWLAELEAAPIDQYEVLFANILRRAHGRVFTLVALVRAETQNSLVRELANQANETVLDHITVLEATGLVDYGSLDDDGIGSISKRVAGPRSPRRARRTATGCGRRRPDGRPVGRPGGRSTDDRPGRRSGGGHPFAPRNGTDRPDPPPSTRHRR